MPEIGERISLEYARDRTVITLAYYNSSCKPSIYLNLTQMKSLQRIFIDIAHMIDDYPIPFAIFAIGMAFVTHHYSGSWHSYVPTK